MFVWGTMHLLTVSVVFLYGVYQASDMIHCVIFVSGLFVWGYLHLQDVCMVPVRMGVISQPQSMMLMHLIDL